MHSKVFASSVGHTFWASGVNWVGTSSRERKKDAVRMRVE